MKLLNAKQTLELTFCTQINVGEFCYFNPGDWAAAVCIGDIASICVDDAPRGIIRQHRSGQPSRKEGRKESPRASEAAAPRGSKMSAVSRVAKWCSPEVKFVLIADLWHLSIAPECSVRATEKFLEYTEGGQLMPFLKLFMAAATLLVDQSQLNISRRQTAASAGQDTWVCCPFAALPISGRPNTSFSRIVGLNRNRIVGIGNATETECLYLQKIYG
jgi:hypothetical protein